jgi:hypothetical protein
MSNPRLKVKSKKEGFGVSFGILDYLNTDYFYTPYSYMIYTIILADAEEKDNAGKGEIDIYKIARTTKIQIESVVSCLENLDEKEFVKFFINSKSISSESIYNLFTSGQDEKVNSFLLGRSGSAVDSIEAFFNNKGIDVFKEYKDHLNSTSLLFSYQILKHKKLKDIKQSVQFDKSVMGILNHFKKTRSFTCETFALTDNFIMINGQIVVKMISDYRKAFSNLDDSKIISKIKDMIDYVFSDSWLIERTWDFSFIRKRENEIIQKTNEFYKAYLKIKEDGNVEKMLDLVKFMESELGFKLSNAQKKYCFLYFSDIISYDESRLIKAFKLSASGFVSENVDLKKLAKGVQAKIESASRTMEQRIL